MSQSQSYAISSKAMVKWKVVKVIEPALKMYMVVGEYEGVIFPATVFADFNLKSCLLVMRVGNHYQVCYFLCHLCCRHDLFRCDYASL